MNITERRTQTILQILQDKHSAEECKDYGEPGYHSPESGVVFCNWNNVPKRVQEYLKEAGYELEWPDEWYIDYDYGKAYRTSPDSYGWQTSIRFTEHGVLTPDDSVEDWLDDTVITASTDVIKALPSWITEADLEERNFIRHNGTFENGLHAGQTDDPKTIAEHCFVHLNADQVVFRMESVGQFDMHFQAWYRGENAQFEDDSMDGDHDSAMASAGFGTDEDYGGCDERL